ncbi:hypothetical protein RiCNE_12740 [Rickettsia endosymbiont of Culicoides newsteadi]|nr:hypothetical protein RiCNE_12740 [Rickettsia endosymbiont of Culicoides newsteadi]
MELETIRTEQLGHLGIVSASIKQLGLIKEIDALLPVSRKKGAKVTMGERVAAMILNGLGFLKVLSHLLPVIFKAAIKA